MAAPPIWRDVGEYRIDTNEENILGKGMYGMVFPAEHAVTHEQVVGKRFLYEKDLPTDEVDREAQIMESLPDHENVVKLIDYQKKDTANYRQVWMILELCSQGTLGKFASNTALTISQKVDLMLQSARGLNHLHDNNLIHRDIKPDNILVHEEKEKPTVKLADFGISKLFDHGDYSITNMTAIGTKSFMAPELFGKGRPAYNKKVDVYSLALEFSVPARSQGRRTHAADQR